MINSTKEAEFPLKKEGVSSDHEKAKASSSSSQWLKLKDPRIVRVSRAFGGKDRHSKVCTIRGLRDRRVRLSVPTAIHLYDLQDRLGLSQPSKVVDWLLNAAKHEIDELPPLPIPPGNFTLGYPSLVTCNNEVSTSHEGSGQNTIWKSKSKEVSREMVSDKENWINRSEEEGHNNSNKHGSNNDCPSSAHVLPNNLLPRANHPSNFLGLLNAMPFGYQWEPNSSADVTQLANHGFINQTDVHSINVVPFPSTLALSTGNNSTTSQILVCPPGATQPYFPSHVAAMEMNQRHTNHYQMLSSSSQNLLTNSMSPSQHLMNQSGKVPFSLLGRPKQLFHSPNSSESHSHKDQDFASK
ncbi:hypothetical protein VNO77_35217 [Canavalia gladiata]|uniref:TCP domain-containing protein n=1 Tax=Canavalia gladiata TaxID=3824 RepID=A0AAN9KEY6_CANGL